MKRTLALIVALLMLAALCAIPAAAADRTEVAGYYEYSATKNEEILSGEAGEASMKWNVPYQAIAPVIDGVINPNEYARFENFEDYITLATTTNYGVEKADALYEKIKDGFFDAYWCWDGQYLYMAFDIQCPDGYSCQPGQDMMLFAHNCLQIGMADVDAVGKDASYVELGFGYDNVNDRDITFAWAPAPTRYESQEEDFKGAYDETSQRLIYELRIDLQPALGWDAYPENGQQVNFAFVLEVAGENDANTNAQVMFCQGIGGQYSMKVNEYFAAITFTGKPDDVVFDPKDPSSGISEEDLEYELREMINFADANVFNTMVGNGASVEQITEGEDTFLRITMEEDGGYVYSTAYPRNLLSDARYLVIKYRNTSEKNEECGVIWQTRQDLDFHLDECYYDFLETNSQWNYLLIDMNGDARWMDYIQTLGLVPCYDTAEAAGVTMDVAWIKCYNLDPYDLYEQYLPTEAETEAPSEETTEAPAGSESDATTEAPAGSEGTTEGAEQAGGCKGVVGAGVLAVVAVIGTAIVLKKKD